MMPNMPTLGIRFEIDKIESADYGTASWKIFWKAVDVSKLGGCVLFEGDTRASLNGTENVYCLAIQSRDEKILDEIRSVLGESVDYRALAASPNFIEGNTVISEPLPEAGRVDLAGNLTGGYNARSALDAVRRDQSRG
ncbi:MAG: hypothetical protein P8Y98_00305 [Anaerolineales bacterium]|jgi:hypothetical protein